ncbi:MULTISPECIES: GNAT family N-acetyltransferase [Subtercola]|uniref:GNAT family N-acetyltransferase n=1 Tax=Subtercola vilae TaxID=2056433 RepID=A0A4T2BCB3_9MICO|nr:MULTISPECIES: GNAT family N-acetyltransferase [Subtercola]MEA9986673.1 GNAT family N-acetyltransferase [Subtercola sp. RTI3]TIH28923.1 GNAT family N-acetyltransferase [Subtercola vilae]
MQIRPFEAAETESVVELWNAAGLVRPWNDPRADIARKLTVQPELFLVGTETADDGAGSAGAGAVASANAGTAADSGAVVIATAMVGYDGHRGWINYLAVDAAHRGRGYARQLMAEAERLLIERGCPKLNLQVRAANTDALAFYDAIGYAPDGAISYGKRLIDD